MNEQRRKIGAIVNNIYESKSSVWKALMTYHDEKSDDIVNRLNKSDVVTILATMDFFGATRVWQKQTAFDLTVPKFRVYDWLAMCVDGRNDDNRRVNNTALIENIRF